MSTTFALTYLFFRMQRQLYRVQAILFKFLKDMLTLSFNYISAIAEVKEGMIKTQRKSQANTT